MRLLALLLLTLSATDAWLARNAVVRSGRFVNGNTGDWESMRGTNVVMKGPPWIPSVHGVGRCGDEKHHGVGCSTFTDADAEYFKAQNKSVIRLGVLWEKSSKRVAQS